MVQIGEKVVLLPLSGKRDNLVAIRSEGAGGYISIPTLTTEERDALTPHTGMVIYNTTTGQLETYDGIQWVGVGVQTPEYTTIERDLLTPTPGMVIYNTTTSQLETYVTDSWTEIYTEKLKALSWIFSGGSNDIAAGEKGFLRLPFDAEIKSWTLLGDQDGTILIDVRKCTYANFPQDSDDSMIGTAAVHITTARKNAETDLSDWGSTSIAKDDIIGIYVHSCALLKQCSLSLQIELT